MSRSDKGKSTPILAVDTGGTFTDLILLRDGRLTTLKVPSDPDDPAAPVLEGMRRILGLEPATRVIHGSTVATNALLERRGARVLLVTNAGFEDVIEIGRQDRPQLYALVGHRPPPLVAREDRVGVGGRVGADGEILAPFDPAEVTELARRVRTGVESIAIALLHSYANPAHEEEIARALSNALPRAPDGAPASPPLPVSVSSRILPEFREYERTATTVANAYVAPVVSGYLRRIASAMGAGDHGDSPDEGKGHGVHGRSIRIMGSAGGSIAIARAIAEPVQTVLSGPAGGVVGALEWARRSGSEAILSFDMGGTSTDVSLVLDTARGVLHRTREGSVGDVPIAIPLLDIHTVGAGGGSIARLDPAGALRVGPESAGARPGPASYGLGGTEVTVTDAHLWLGRLPPTAFLGGERPLDRERVRTPLERLARAAGATPDAIAQGVLDVANAAMERALRVVSVERGVDPAGLDLVAFGGAAGLHAAELVAQLGLRRAILPPDPGLLSAFGMLVAPVVRDRSRSVFLRVGAEEVFRELEAAVLGDMVEEGLARDSVTLTRLVDARYRDQSFELQLSVDREGGAAGDGEWIEAFHRAHEERFGYRREGVEVEAVTLRVRAEGPGAEVPSGSESEARPGATGAEPGPPARTPVTWRGTELGALLVPRDSIGEGATLEGPAVVTEYSSTTWCPPGWRIEAHPSRALVLSPILGTPPG